MPSSCSLLSENQNCCTIAVAGDFLALKWIDLDYQDFSRKDRVYLCRLPQTKVIFKLIESAWRKRLFKTVNSWIASLNLATGISYKK